MLRRDLAAIGAFCALTLAAAAGPPQYTLVEVTPQPLRNWNAYDLGAQGQVVGRTYDLNVSPPLSRGFLWQNGVMTLLDGPAGETITEARCIDDNGVIYGGYADRRFSLNSLKMNPLRWVGGTPTPYPNNQGINSSMFFGCAPTSGIAVGWAKPFQPGALGWRGEFGYANEFDFGNGDPVRAFRWDASGGAVITKWIGSHDDVASDINNSGQMAVYIGSFELSGAAIFDPRFGLAHLPGLGTGEASTWAFAINESGQVVGRAQVAGKIERPVRWFNGSVTDLGVLPGFIEGEALDINDAGVIVGPLSDQNFAFGVMPTAGFVYVGGTMYNLNTLIPPGSGFTIHSALALNNAGQILVRMIDNATSRDRYAVLTPGP